MVIAIIIGIAFLSFSIPEFTRPTTNTVVAAELCVATVIRNPISNPLNGLSVTFAKESKLALLFVIESSEPYLPSKSIATLGTPSDKIII